jgi:cytoskeletal protein RodZ
VASFGQNLRQAREARKITLQEIADTTKIGTRALQALEDERFDLLPGGIFNKGFVRAYARSVGLDEEKTIAAYLEAAKVAPSETDMDVLASQVTAARAEKREPWSPNAATLAGVVAILVALGLGSLWLREHRKEAREQAESQSHAQSAAVTTTAPASIPQAPPTVVPSDPNAAGTPVANATPNAAEQNATQNATQNAASNVPTAPTASLSPAPKTNAVGTPPVGALSPPRSAEKQGTAPVEVSISATARSWISVLSDDKPAETLTLDPDKPESSSRSFKAKDRVRLTVGNPAGVSVTYNGKPTGKLGAAGQRVTITFTPEGMQKQ